MLSVLMKKTQARTQSCTICEALLGSFSFGVKATKTVLSEVYKKYVFCDHWSLSAAWKVLQANDTSAVGGLIKLGSKHFDQWKDLCSINVEYYYHDLQSRCMYKLHDIDQHMVNETEYVNLVRCTRMTWKKSFALFCKLFSYR